MGLVVNVARVAPDVRVSFVAERFPIPVTVRSETTRVSVLAERLGSSFPVTFRRVSPPVFVFWGKTSEEVVDLVPFSVAEGMYLTREGYTILVRNN